MGNTYDFSGWATRNNLRCSDGRVIMRDAFKENDGQTVPLVWNHQHNDTYNVLGHALLENRDDGVYAYCSLNNTESGRTARLLVEHGDVSALSIYANQLKQKGSNVIHGAIKEVSLVLAGANPGASIEHIIQHGDISDDEAIIYTGEDFALSHADGEEKKKEEPEMAKEPNVNTSNDDEETVADVFNTLSEKQKTVVYALIGQVLEDKKGGSDDEEDDDSEGGQAAMKHNVFDVDEQESGENVISHSEMMAVINDAKRYGSMKESALAHGINDIDYLFPDATLVDKPPQWISRDMDWVKTVMNGVHNTPFSRIKSMFANLTEDEARAKGYIKGKMKKEQVFSLLKRATTPQTVYKKQKLDRDDIIDITDFDVVAWIKSEMRFMLDEEIARAILIGDGRLASDDDHISESNIRPIWKDEDLYTIKSTIEIAADATDDDIAKAIERAAVKARKDYKGSGNPVLFTTEDYLTDMLLREDSMGRKIYANQAELATALRVKEIVTVEVMENQTRTNEEGKTVTLAGIIVNLNDYNVGADKGGSVNLFDDFDIDYNKYTYLIETRCSGALVKPYSAIALEIYKATE